MVVGTGNLKFWVVGPSENLGSRVEGHLKRPSVSTWSL